MTLSRSKNNLWRSLLHRIVGLLGQHTITEDEWTATLEMVGSHCVYCGAPWMVRDHLVGPKAGGTEQFGNLVPACKPCNDSRRDTPWSKFMENAARSDYKDVQERVGRLHASYRPLPLDRLEELPFVGGPDMAGQVASVVAAFREIDNGTRAMWRLEQKRSAGCNGGMPTHEGN